MVDVKTLLKKKFIYDLLVTQQSRLCAAKTRFQKERKLILNDSNELFLMKQDVHKSVHKNSKTPDYHAFVLNEKKTKSLLYGSK